MANNRELSQFANVVGYNGGNIGIGTDNPSEKLSIENGNIFIRDASDDDSYIYFTNSPIANRRSYIGAVEGTGNSNSLVFATNADGADAVEKLRITSDGKIGIGTDDPARLLHLHESNSNEALITFTTPTTGATASDGFRVGMNGSEEALVWNNESGIIKFGTANTERLRITSGGNFGIGETVPLGKLHVKTGDSGASSVGASADELVIEGSGHAGMTILSGDNQQGIINFGETDDNNIGGITYNHGDNDLLFRTDNAERMRITSAAVRIGNSLTSNAAGRFQVVEERSSGDDNDCNAYFETNRQDWNIKTYYNRSGTHYHLVFVEQNTERGSIRGNDGSNVTFNQGSDYRWKENIVEMTGTEGIEICKRLKPSKYNWIENREQTGEINTVDGFIAHEVEEAGVLGAVVGEKDAVNEDGSIKGQLLDYGQMTPVLAAGIKGLIAKVETLETQNADLLARVTALEGS